MSTKQQLQEILLEYGKNMRAYMRSEAETEGIGYPMSWDDEATQAILDLLDKSLPKDKMEPIDLGQLTYEEGYNQALADVRKVIKEESNE